jgi:hypothetical protein
MGGTQVDIHVELAEGADAAILEGHLDDFVGAVMASRPLRFELTATYEPAAPAPEPEPEPDAELGLALTFDTSDGSITVPISRYPDMPIEKSWPVGSGPHTVHVRATRGGQPAPEATVKVKDLAFDNAGIYTAVDDPADGTAVTFTDAGKEGSTTATVICDVTVGAETREMSAPLMLTATAAPAPATPFPDALDFTFDDAPAPAGPAGPAGPTPPEPAPLIPTPVQGTAPSGFSRR